MRSVQDSDEALKMPAEALEQRVDRLLRELLDPRNRAELEKFRFRGSANRVYRIPLTPDGEEFIIVKLLPTCWAEFRNRCKRFFRNLIYDEHDVPMGRRRTQMEIERAREWQAEGFPVAPLIETELPEVRIFQGLPYRTFYTILKDQSLSPERKLRILKKVVRAISVQHKRALQKGQKSLVHREPGPQNIMFDLQNEVTYWFDLEHPSEYPRMSLEALMVRGLRLLVYGVLEDLGDQFDDVIRVLVDNYELTPVLQEFVKTMERTRTSPLCYVYQLVRRPWTFRLRRQIAQTVAYYLEMKTAVAKKYIAPETPASRGTRLCEVTLRSEGRQWWARFVRREPGMRPARQPALTAETRGTHQAYKRVCSVQTTGEALKMSAEALEQRVDRLLRELLDPGNRAELEQFRFRGSNNRVYRIPLPPDGEEFIIVKLLPSQWIEMRNRVKRATRNLLYGEHDVATHRERVQMEIGRAREWREEGLPVPSLIETSLPDVRVFLGLPYPTLYTIFADDTLSPERKLQILKKVVQALSYQHKTAFRRNKKSLVHRDPGPWNIMVDPKNDTVYWFDLEHPSEYPKMTLNALMVRAIRILIYGLLEQLGDQVDEVIRAVVDNYETTSVLQEFVKTMERRRLSPIPYLFLLSRSPRTVHLRRQIAQKISSYLESKQSSAMGIAPESLAL